MLIKNEYLTKAAVTQARTNTHTHTHTLPQPDFSIAGERERERGGGERRHSEAANTEGGSVGVEGGGRGGGAQASS